MPNDESTVRELEALFPVDAQVRVAGRVIEVRALPIEEISKMGRALEPIFEAIRAAAGTERRLVDVIADNVPAVINLVAVATGEDREWLRKLPAGQFVRLGRAVIDVNVDFFDQSLGLMGSRGVQTLLQTLTGLGLIQSTTSSDTAT